MRLKQEIEREKEIQVRRCIEAYPLLFVFFASHCSPPAVVLLLFMCFCPPSVSSHFKQSTTFHLILDSSFFPQTHTHLCMQKQTSKTSRYNTCEEMRRRHIGRKGKKVQREGMRRRQELKDGKWYKTRKDANCNMEINNNNGSWSD